MSHSLDSARERLKRADVHLNQLDKEVAHFLRDFPSLEFHKILYNEREPTFTDEERVKMKEFQDRVNRDIPSTFRIVTGEIIHHLRSAFDHVAWQLSSVAVREHDKLSRLIEFPVAEKLSVCGLKSDKMCPFCRKVQGISSAVALARIEQLQPYHRGDVYSDPLWLIHDLDRTDKHRDLLIACYALRTDTSAVIEVDGWTEHRPYEIRPRRTGIGLGGTKYDLRIKLTPQISLAKIGEREDKSLVPFLQYLLNFARDSVESFVNDF